MNNGGCEDSVNIIGSTGIIEKINVNNAIADAIDLDFSNLKIKNLYVNSAGNDCFDVSGGIYSVINGNLAYCKIKVYLLAKVLFLQWIISLLINH